MLVIGLWAFGGFATVHAQDLDLKTLSLIPIQDGGRVKPFDTFARESARLVTGRETFLNEPSVALVMDWVSRPNDWADDNFILLSNLDLKDKLKIPAAQKAVSPNFLLKQQGFLDFANACYLKQQDKAALDPMEKEALEVYKRLQRFEDVASGEAFTMIPITDPQTQGWTSLAGLQRAYQAGGSHPPDSAKALLSLFADLIKSYDDKDNGVFLLDSSDLAQALRQIGGADYPSGTKMALEVQYNQVKPFRWAWVIHLAAFILMGLSFLLNAPKLFRPGFALFILGILVALYGFVLRCTIAGRPPVSNMYESILWVTFGMTVFALLFELIFKARSFAAAGSALAVVGFILADNVPNILDPSIQPLEPVLRSNFWLTIHVLTITLSYAAFLLSLGIGHVCLWTLWRHPKDEERLKTQTRLLYRVVQVGVVLLASGTILGGVWASYSWGRFWGWDPKETWALIALLGYIAVLHGRLGGWLKAKGFVLGVVLAFLGVLMAWYGVNFVLGVGLHSYGFSKGGLPYVIGFVVAELALVIFVATAHRRKA